MLLNLLIFAFFVFLGYLIFKSYMLENENDKLKKQIFILQNELNKRENIINAYKD